MALTLVTTEKDLARLRGREGLPEWAREIVPFAVTLEFDGRRRLAQVCGRPAVSGAREEIQEVGRAKPAGRLA